VGFQGQSGSASAKDDKTLAELTQEFDVHANMAERNGGSCGSGYQQGTGSSKQPAYQLDSKALHTARPGPVHTGE